MKGSLLYPHVIGKFYRYYFPTTTLLILSLTPGTIDPLNNGCVIKDDVTPVSTKHSYFLPPIVRVRSGSPSGPLLRDMARPVKVAWHSVSLVFIVTCQGYLGTVCDEAVWEPRDPGKGGAEDSLQNGALGRVDRS